jgi:aryl-alcohol dehydrogenase-like predicted oxidoreductase
MKYRKLGKNGPSVSAIGMGRGNQAVKFDDEEAVKSFDAAIRRAYDLGINFFDSSDAY